MYTSPDAATCTGRSEASKKDSGRNLLDVADIEDQLSAYKRNVRLGIANSPNEKSLQKRNKVIPLRSLESTKPSNAENPQPAQQNRPYTRFEPVCDSPKKKVQPIRDVYASITETSAATKAPTEPAKPLATSSKSLPSILRPRTYSDDSNKRGSSSSSSKLRFGTDVKSPKSPFMLPEHAESPKARDNVSYGSGSSEFSPLVGLKLLGAEDEDNNTIAESVQPNGVQDADLVNGAIRGVMRLTEDGLKAHEQKTFREPKKTSDKLLAIKQEQAERQWYRHQRRQCEAGSKTGLPPRSFQEKKPAVEHSSRNETGGVKKRSSILGIFKQNKSEAAVKVLEEENSGSAHQKKMQQKELEEFQRIEKKRQDYLARQRALEQRPPSFIEKKTRDEMSTMSSTKSGALPPCVVCGLGTRSHIAAPCMHYAFCEACVTAGLGASCPVCSTKNVKFVPVAV